MPVLHYSNSTVVWRLLQDERLRRLCPLLPYDSMAVSELPALVHVRIVVLACCCSMKLYTGFGLRCTMQRYGGFGLCCTLQVSGDVGLRRAILSGDFGIGRTI